MVSTDVLDHESYREKYKSLKPFVPEVWKKKFLKEVEKEIRKRYICDYNRIRLDKSYVSLKDVLEVLEKISKQL